MIYIPPQVYLRSERQANGRGHTNHDVLHDHARPAALVGGGADHEVAAGAGVGARGAGRGAHHPRQDVPQGAHHRALARQAG